MNNGKIIKEISKKELKRNSKKRIEIKVNNVKEAAVYLEKNNIFYEIISDEYINIYDSVNITELVENLSKRNCIIKSFSEKEEKIENYYINLIGGNNND